MLIKLKLLTIFLLNQDSPPRLFPDKNSAALCLFSR